MALSKPTRAIAAFVAVLTVLSSIPLTLGFLSRWHPAFDTLSHFRAHIGLAVVAGGLLLLATPLRKHGLLALALGAGALWTTVPAFPLLGPTHASAENRADERPVYRLLQLNLRFDNAQAERVLSLIGRVRPDVITLDEASAMWRERLSSISAAYPYSIMCPGTGWVGGVAVLSRRPFVGANAQDCLHGGAFAMTGIDFGGRVLDVAALHLTWPWPFEQPQQLERLEPTLAAIGRNAIVGGDLNAVTWSDAVRRIETAAGLTHVPGLGPTWLDRHLPEWLKRYAGLPIDQVFAKGDVSILSARTLEPVGSDHLPVLVEFSISGDGRPEEHIETATAALPEDLPPDRL